MKYWKFLLSSNNWEYATSVQITAKEISCGFKTPEDKKAWGESDPDVDGDTIIADGVEIKFDEVFEFHGEGKWKDDT